MQEVKNLVIPGIAGILLACAIFSAFVMVPWASTTSTWTSPTPPPGWLGGALSVRSFVSNFTEPLGVGSEGTLTVIVTSTLNASNVVVQFDMSRYIGSWPMGIDFIGENLTNWSGDLRANVSMVFNARIKAVEAGSARLLVITTWYPSDGSGGVYVRENLFILVEDNDIQVSHEPIAPPGQMPFLPPLNVTMSSP